MSDKQDSAEPASSNEPQHLELVAQGLYSLHTGELIGIVIPLPGGADLALSRESAVALATAILEADLNSRLNQTKIVRPN